MNITKTYERFQSSEALFRCPVCASTMKFRNENSLVCLKNHCFDLAKQGYVNFVPNQNKMKYTKDLFESRRNIFQAGFYDPLIKSIEEVIQHYTTTLSTGDNRKSTHVGSIRILDAGCGEGFFISQIADKSAADDESAEIFAMDIVKDAIVLAAKENKKIKWLAGDLAKTPLADSSMDMILNIFSPANYGEFTRVLKEDGILIKVIPGRDYLKELRESAKGQLSHEEYSNQQVLDYFQKNMLCQKVDSLYYQLPVTKHDLENFVKMTPMMFHVDSSKIQFDTVTEITIDVEILIGKKN